MNGLGIVASDSVSVSLECEWLGVLLPVTL